VVADVEQRVLVLLVESAADPEVLGVGDGGLGPQRPAFVEVLLDLRALVVDL
jgi:hypothetical protein